jgi:hypothetical protein
VEEARSSTEQGGLVVGEERHRALEAARLGRKMNEAVVEGERRRRELGRKAVVGEGCDMEAAAAGLGREGSIRSSARREKESRCPTREAVGACVCFS